MYVAAEILAIVDDSHFDEIQLIWTPVHSVAINELVHKAVKKPTLGSTITKLLLSSKDGLKIITEKIMDAWNKEYQQTSRKKEKFFANIFPKNADQALVLYARIKI